MALIDIFFELHKRYPTPEEAEEFLEEVSLRFSFSNAHIELPEDTRAKEIERLLEEPVEQVSVDEIYSQFQEKIQGIHLDNLIQTMTYFWKAGPHYYADNLTIVSKLG